MPICWMQRPRWPPGLVSRPAHLRPVADVVRSEVAEYRLPSTPRSQRERTTRARCVSAGIYDLALTQQAYRRHASRCRRRNRNLCMLARVVLHTTPRYAVSQPQQPQYRSFHRHDWSATYSRTEVAGTAEDADAEAPMLRRQHVDGVHGGYGAEDAVAHRVEADTHPEKRRCICARPGLDIMLSVSIRCTCCRPMMAS